MLLLTRIDYSRFRELRVGIYTFLCASIALVFVFGFAARGSRRSFELPFFSFQPSELGKLLLVLALAGFVIDGARRGSRGPAHGALPLPRPGTGCARLPAARPRHLAGVRGRHPRRHVLRRRPLDALRGHRRAPSSRSIALVLVVAPAVGAPGPQGLPGGTADVVPAPRRASKPARAISRTNQWSPSAPVR